VHGHDVTVPDGVISNRKVVFCFSTMYFHFGNKINPTLLCSSIIPIVLLDCVNNFGSFFTVFKPNK
jgi:hypothetical protein